MHGLETLHVCNNLLNGAKRARAWCTLLDAAPRLTRLDVCSDCLRDEGAALLALVLQGMTCLQTLNLNDTRIGEGGMTALAPALAALPCLHTLHLCSNSLWARAVSALQPVLAREGRSKQTLDLSWNLMHLNGAHALAAALSTATQLQRLSLLRTKLGDESWAALAPALSCLAPSLQSLELGQESLETAGTTVLASALHMLARLTRLQAVAMGFTSAAMMAISPALMGMWRLQVLDLHCTAMGAEGTAAIALVLPALAGSLMRLNQSYCSIDAKAAANSLGPALAQAIGIVESRLDGNGFGPQGAEWLVPVLSALPHLRELGLWSCKLGLQGCMAVTRGLKDRDGTRVALGDNLLEQH